MRNRNLLSVPVVSSPTPKPRLQSDFRNKRESGLLVLIGRQKKKKMNAISKSNCDYD